MKITKRRVLRYFGLALAIVFLLWMVALVAVYFFVDVNVVKKTAVSYVNENTKGELSVGEVKLKLFPMVHFEVKDIIFKSSPDFQRRDLFKCEEAKLSFGIVSLIFGKPNISLGLENPYVDFIVKEKNINNISDLMIKKEAVDVSTGKKEQPDKEEKKDNLSYLFMSRFTFDVSNGEVKYTSPKVKYDVKSLSFKLMIDPADKSIELKAGSPLEVEDKKFSIRGDWKTDIEIKPIGNDNFDVHAMLDATKLSYTSPSFIKPKGIPLKLEFSASGNDALLTVKKATITLFKPWLTLTGKITDLKEDTTPLVLTVSALPIESGNIKKLLPSLEAYDLNGLIESKLALSGSLQKLLLDIELNATNVKIKSKSFNKAVGSSLKVKMLATKSKENVDIQSLKVWLLDDVIEADGKITNLDSESPTLQTNIKYFNSVTKNDLIAKISNSSKNPNSFTIDATSSHLDLNGFMPAEKKVSNKKGAKSSETPEASTPIDKKKELVTKEQIKSLNESLAKYSLAVSIKASKILAKGFTFNNFVFQANASKGNFNINKFKVDTLGGTLSSGLTVIPNVTRPSYTANFEVSGLKVKEVVEALMPDLKGVLDGTLSGKISIAASGYTVGDVQKSLTGNGNFAFNNFVYSSKELNEVLSKTLGDKLGKIAPTQGRNIFGGNPGWETVQGIFTIKDERIYVERILAKEKEYLAEGKGNIDFNNYIDMDLMVTVPYKNLPYEPFKVDKKELSQLPIHLTGPATKPKLDGAKLVQYFLEKTVDMQKKKLKEQANTAIQKFKGQATDKLKQAIKGFKF